MNNPGVVHVASDVLSQEVNGETVLLNLNNDSFFGLDAIGTRIWQLICEFGDLDKVHAVMLEEFDVSDAQLRHDINQLIKKLVEAGLVKIETD